MRGVWRRWRPRRRPVDDEIGEEIRDHLQRRAVDLVATGLTPAEAARRATIEFGGVEGYKEKARESRRGPSLLVWFEQAALELSRAVRRLAHTPVFTIFSIVGIAVGVGVTTAVYAVVEDFANLLRVHDPAGLVFVTTSTNSRTPHWQVAVPAADLSRLRSLQHSFRLLAASEPLAAGLSVGEFGDLARIEAVSGDYFAACEVDPVLGRLLTASDGEPNAPAVLVIGERYWRERLGGNPTIVGSTVHVGQRPFVVVGIVPDHFWGLSVNAPAATDVWIPRESRPLGSDRTSETLAGTSEAAIFGRLVPGIPLASAAAELKAIGERLDLSNPLERDPRRSGPMPRRQWSTISLADFNRMQVIKNVRGEALVVVLVGLILVVACTNLANLMLARGTARENERAVQRSLGASRLHLVGELLRETGLIALCGGVGAYLLIRVFIVLSSRAIQVGPSLYMLAPQWSVSTLLLTVFGVVAGFVVFGLMPALSLTQTRPTAATTVAGGISGASVVLIALQVAIASALLLVSAMCLRGAETMWRHDAGVDYTRLSVANLKNGLGELDRSRADDSEGHILNALRQNPEFESVAVATTLPFGVRYRPLVDLSLLDHPFDPTAAMPDNSHALAVAASPEIFRTLDVAIIRGRALTLHDDAGPYPNIVVDPRLANRLFGTLDVIGRQLLMRGSQEVSDRTTLSTATIVGVTEQTDTDVLFGEKMAVVYLPRRQVSTAVTVLVGRALGNPRHGAETLRRAARKADPSLLVSSAGDGSQMLTGDYVAIEPSMEAASGLGLLALVLAMAGLYGVLLQAVQRRTHEMGVRVALGADPRRIVRLIVSEGMRPVFVGLVIGFFLAMLGRKILEGQSISMTELTDPVALLLASVPLVVAGLCACYFPARRASRVDPTIALRDC